MSKGVDEVVFYERLEQFSTERREDILRGLRHRNKEYASLREEFGQLYIQLSGLLGELDQTQRNVIDRFSQVYSSLIIFESNQIYLQGQVDGMRIIKKLNEKNNEC